MVARVAIIAHGEGMGAASSTPIVVRSGYSEAPQKRAAWDPGANDDLTKPGTTGNGWHGCGGATDPSLVITMATRRVFRNG